MKYNVYAVSDGTTINVSEAIAWECHCDICLSRWIVECVGGPFDCPYCASLIETGRALDSVAEQSTRASEYKRDLMSAGRGLWLGVIDEFQAWESIEITVRRGLTQAYYEGIQECGIEPSEMTPEERQQLNQAIFNETAHIDGLVDFIIANSKANDGKLKTVMGRIDLWVLRYSDVAARARLMACGNRKLKWVQGPTSDSCPTCTSMNGKVKRASYWQEKGPHPKAPPNPTIQCSGYRCRCDLVPTDEPASKGPLPRWP